MTYMAQIIITSPQAVGSVTITAQEPGVVTYHIYWDGRIEKHIPKTIQKGYEKKYKYVYHSSDTEEYEICTLDFFKIKEKENGIKLFKKPERTDISEDLKVSEGQTERRILYENEDVAEFGSNNGATFWRLYKAKSNNIEIVRMPDYLNFISGTVTISYTFTATKRRYASPNAFAGFIGALATTRLKLQTTGSCFKYGSCFPSSEHVNGKSIDTIYLNDKDEQLFITAMKKFGFNKQVTGRNKKVFTDAIQEKKGTLHNSHLHSGFNEAVVKIVTLSILILFLISCKQKVLSQPCQNLIVKSSNNVFLLGDSIVANSTFSNQVNTSCATGKEGCILEKLTTDYYSSLSKESGSVLKLDKTHQLSLKIYKKKSSTEEHIRAYALLSVNNLVSDSILCYEYYNNANTLSCYEQIYYININQRKIWTVMLTYDEESAEANNVNIYKIDLNTNRFRKEVSKNEKAYKSASDKETAFIEGLYPMTHHLFLSSKDKSEDKRRFVS